MQIKAIMTQEVDVVDPETSVRAVAQKMRDDDVGAVPVAENGTLLGMVTDRDIVLRAVAEGAGQLYGAPGNVTEGPILLR